MWLLTDVFWVVIIAALAFGFFAHCKANNE